MNQARREYAADVRPGHSRNEGAPLPPNEPARVNPGPPARARLRCPGRGRPAGRWRSLVAAASVLLPAASAALAEGPSASAESDSVVGAVEFYEARYEDTLLDVARRFGMGFEEIKLANPGVDVWLPGEGTIVRLPSRFVLPAAPRRGIVVNVPEMRLYYYPKDGTAVRTWPISIGRPDHETPLGTTTVVRKKAGPIWYPTESIREEYAARGEILPRVVRPGHDNPLGSHAVYLGFPTYLIHGTNRPYSIGMRVSHGCIRMYPEHIAELYGLVSPGTPVSIVHQGIKAGWSEDELYVEVHPVSGVPADQARPTMTEVVESIIAATSEGLGALPLDWGRVEAALADANGIPVVVGRRASGTDPSQSPLVRAASIVPLSL